jgi:mono/diheme cytochrome c family protein
MKRQKSEFELASPREQQIMKSEPSPRAEGGQRSGPGEGVPSFRPDSSLTLSKKERILLALLLSVLTVGSFGCHKQTEAAPAKPALRAYDVEPDWDDPTRTTYLNYQQAQGKRIFYTYCVWCHADATPAGPSNRSNVTPNPPLFNDGATFNPLSDEFMQNTITLGGSAMGKSAMMPPWGRTLSQDDIKAVIAFERAIAQPAYQPPARPAPQYGIK